MPSPSTYLPRETVKELSQRSNLWGAWLTFHVWAVILVSGAIFLIWPNPLTFIFAVLMIGSRQHGLAILMHDAAHGILFNNRKINDFVGQYVLGAPYGGDMQSYRHYHLKHHLYTQSEDDPDLPLSAKFPVTKASLRRKFFRDITGKTYIRLKIAEFKSGKNQSGVAGADAFMNGSVWPTRLINLAMFGILAALGYWWAYFALWALPLMTWFMVVIRLRNIAEHALTTRDDNPLTHARTTRTNWFTRIFLSPYWVNYHVEHHAYMYAPCYRLKPLHNAFIQSGYENQMDIKPGYRAVMKLATI